MRRSQLPVWRQKGGPKRVDQSVTDCSGSRDSSVGFKGKQSRANGPVVGSWRERGDSAGPVEEGHILCSHSVTAP